MASTEKMNSQITSNFLQNTSLHGCNSVGNNLRSRWSRIFWFLVVAAGFGGLVYTSIDLMVAINQRNVQTVFRLNYKNKIQFPAITICNSCPYDLSKANISEEFKDVVWSNSAWKALASSEMSNISLGLQYVNKLGENTGTVMEEFFKHVRWNGDDLDVLSTFDTVSTSVTGNCFIFNGAKAREQNISYITTVSGIRAGLEIIADVRQDSCNSGYHHSAGLMLYVDSINEVSPSSSPDVILSPGTATHILLQKTQTHFLAKPYTSVGQYYCNQTRHYSRTNCISDCVIKKLREICPCLPKIEDEDIDFDRLEQNCSEPFSVYMACWNENKGQVENDAAKGVDCHCTYPCVLTEYRIDSSFSYFPNDDTRQRLVDLGVAPNVENAGRNLIKFNMNFKKMLVETIEHKPDYSTDQILGAVGGYLGLCLGASLLSVVEVTEILIVKACLMFKHVFCTMKTSKVESFQSS